MGFKTVLFYFIYSVAALLVLAYALFPGQTASWFICDRINRMNPDLMVSMEKISPILPIGFKTTNVNIRLPDTAPLILDYLEIAPKLLSVFKDKQSAVFDAEAYRGSIEGNITSSFTNSMADYGLKVIFSGIEMENIQYKNSHSDVKLSFITNGRAELKVSGEIAESGWGTIHLAECNADITNPFLNQLEMSAFYFDTVDLDYTLKKNWLNIMKLNASGSELTIRIKGSIKLKIPFKKSMLNLKGSIVPDPSYLKNFAGIVSIKMLFSDSRKGGIPFKISGTMEKPIFGI